MAIEDFWFDEWSDIFYFAIAPVYAPFQLWNTGVGFATQGYYPLGEPDWRDTTRDAALWATAAGLSWGYHALVHPGKYEFVTGARAAKFLAHVVPAPVYAATALAAVPSGLALANKKVIESAPEEEQPGLWRMFSQALTGTGFGVGGADVTGL